ncbi:MAG: phosphatase PAP2 family protein, partial [Myxococcales bacterium]
MRAPILLTFLLAATNAFGAEKLVEPIASDVKLKPSEKALKHKLTWNASHDVPLTVVLGAGWIATELNKPGIAPAACRWCSTNALDRGVTRAVGVQNTAIPATLTDVTAFGVMPLATLGTLSVLAYNEDRFDETPVNALIMLQSLAFAGALNQSVKFLAGRERPFVAELTGSEKRGTREPADNNLSFYSGHTGSAFALAVSAGTIAHLRGYENEAVVWAVGLPIAAAVGYGRIAAKKHYLSDVLVGAGLSGALGFAVP